MKKLFILFVCVVALFSFTSCEQKVKEVIKEVEKEVPVEVPVEKVASIKLKFPDTDEDGTPINKDYFYGEKMEIWFLTQDISVSRASSTQKNITIIVTSGDSVLKDSFNETDRTITLNNIPCVEYRNLEFRKNPGLDSKTLHCTCDKFTPSVSSVITVELDYLN